MAKNQPELYIPALSPGQLSDLDISCQLLGFALDKCIHKYQLDTVNASEYLRSYAVQIIDFYLDAYSEDQDFSLLWLPTLKAITVHKVMGVLESKGMSLQVKEDFRKLITHTVDNHVKRKIDAVLNTVSAQNPAKNGKSSFVPKVSLGDQIKNLQAESCLTVEAMAEKVEVSTRAIYKHLANDTSPRRTQIVAYERMFSKILQREVKLKVQ